MKEPRRESFSVWLSDLTSQARKAVGLGSEVPFRESSAALLDAAILGGYSAVARLLSGDEADLTGGKELIEVLGSFDLAEPVRPRNFAVWERVAEMHAQPALAARAVAQWTDMGAAEQGELAGCLCSALQAATDYLSRDIQRRLQWDYTQFGSGASRMNLERPEDRQLVAAAMVMRGRAWCAALLDPRCPDFGDTQLDARPGNALLDFVKRVDRSRWSLEEVFAGPRFVDSRGVPQGWWLLISAFAFTDPICARGLPSPIDYASSLAEISKSLSADPYFESWWAPLKGRSLYLIAQYHVEDYELKSYMMDGTLVEYMPISDDHLKGLTSEDLRAVAISDVRAALTELARTRLINPPPLWRL